METSNTSSPNKAVDTATVVTKQVGEAAVNSASKAAKSAVKSTPNGQAKPESSKKAGAAPKKVTVKAATKPVSNASSKAVATKQVKDKKVKDKKVKMVRDSISIPKTEFQVLSEMKARAGKLGVEVKKTELIRAGIKVLAALADTAFVAAIRAVPNIKTGRPAKSL
jgi:hypothetical protein